MAASHQDATGASLLARIMYWWNGTNAVPANASTPLPIASTGPAAGTATASVQAPVASTTSSTTILAANASRRGVILHNSDANNLRIKFGATASASRVTRLIGPGDTWVMDEPIYSGIIDGIWDADGSGSAHVTELT